MSAPVPADVRVVKRCDCGEQVLARGSVEDYPYDPRAVAELEKGLNKLRAIEHRATAACIFDEHFITEHNEVCRKFAARERGRAADSSQAELTRLRALAKAASEGLWGKAGLGAHEIIFGTNQWGSEPRYDLKSLLVFERELKGSGAERMETPRPNARR